MDAVSTPSSALDDHDLVLAFESLGDNCELGILQRKVGVEPLGLLRFAGAPLRDLIRALRSRFAGIADPDRIRIEPENGEYMVRLAACNFTRHADVKVGEMPPEAVHAQQCRVIRFLANKLIEDLQNPCKILVFRQNEALSAADLVDLRIALSGYGRNTLLWVQPACVGHPPGSVDVVDDQMMTGYVRRLADRDTVPALDVASWLQVLRSAHAIWQQADGGPLVPPAHAAAPRTELTFGRDGNAGPSLGVGWSGAEAGFTWSIGERSVLTWPCQATPRTTGWKCRSARTSLRRCCLGSGWTSRSAERGSTVSPPCRVARSAVSCRAGLVAGRDVVEVALQHPDASSPLLVEGHGDTRRLAVAFYRMTLVCA